MTTNAQQGDSSRIMFAPGSGKTTVYSQCRNFAVSAVLPPSYPTPGLCVYTHVFADFMSRRYESGIPKGHGQAFPNEPACNGRRIQRHEPTQ
jgi:hypothetical protein